MTSNLNQIPIPDRVAPRVAELVEVISRAQSELLAICRGILAVHDIPVERLLKVDETEKIMLLLPEDPPEGPAPEPSPGDTRSDVGA